MAPEKCLHRRRFGAVAAEVEVTSRHRSLASETEFWKGRGILAAAATEPWKEDWRDRSSISGQVSAEMQPLQSPLAGVLFCSPETASMTLLSPSSPASPFQISMCYRFFQDVALG